MQGETLTLECDCECDAWLEITPDGILAIEDKDGLRLSIDLPEWLADVIYAAMLEHARDTYSQTATASCEASQTSDPNTRHGSRKI